ncbi:hypothetical protein DLAC_07711 [Tieghemostelium lacteum]|uniref:Cyclin N-terminal domain-containing protein n=1 Tax=Tieghemostelium lacteum TaxID=361077 RepID=A0A151ZA72_TIELA|nr:hypothetical protein DLAC_07711 [Tieghemostelium lacteum]|eukprot:KYQ90842.1 hypothetical protein DLAC_07711 [Tieghemostelium lacteum]
MIENETNLFKSFSDNDNNNSNTLLKAENIPTILKIISNKSQKEVTQLWDSEYVINEDPIEFIICRILVSITDYGDQKKFSPIGAFYNPSGIKPSISIIDYIKRLVKYLGCSKCCFIIALIYIDRIIKEKKYNVNSYNIHRLYFTCILVSIKFFDDFFYPVHIYARVGGVSTQETNKMESYLLELLDFNVNIQLNEFNDYLYYMDQRSYIKMDIENQSSDVDDESDDEENSDEEDQNTKEEDIHENVKRSPSSTSDDLPDEVGKNTNRESITIKISNSSDNSTNSTSSASSGTPTTKYFPNHLHDKSLSSSSIPVTIRSSMETLQKNPMGSSSNAISILKRKQSSSIAISNSLDNKDILFKTKFPQQMFISPSLKQRYRSNSYSKLQSQKLNGSSPSSSSSSPNVPSN